jgi:hypothetical protein
MTLTAPTIVAPANGGSYATNNPALSVSFVYTGPDIGVKIEVQIDRENTFGNFSGERQTFFMDAAPATSGQLNKNLLSCPGTVALTAGTWCIRALCQEYSTGTQSAWSTVNTFTDSASPFGSSLQPTGAISVPYLVGSNLHLSWVYNNPLTTPQHGYIISIGRVSDGAFVWKSQMIGGFATEVPTPNPFADVPLTFFDGISPMFHAAGGPWANADVRDQLLFWNLTLKDTNGVTGLVSANQQFYIRPRPVIAITSAAIGRPFDALAWTFSATDSRTQASYQVDIYNHPTSTPVIDPAHLVFSKRFAGASLLFDPDGRFRYVNGQWYSRVLTVTDSANVTQTVTQTVQAVWPDPALPASLTADTSAHDTTGRVRLTWPNTNKATSGFIAWRLYRKLATDTLWTLLVNDQDGTLTTHTFDDFNAPTGVAINYAVTQVADTTGDGDAAESAFTTQATTTITTNFYWLATPYDPDQPMLVFQLNPTQDTFTDPYETAEILLIGRGRRKEYGTRWGYTGTLVCQLRERTDLTARGQRLLLNQVKAAKRSMYLRNPFGDVFFVAIDDIQFERDAGVGHFEFGTLTVPYSEVVADDAVVSPAATDVSINRYPLIIGDPVFGRLSRSNRV